MTRLKNFLTKLFGKARKVDEKRKRQQFFEVVRLIDSNCDTDTEIVFQFNVEDPIMHSYIEDELTSLSNIIKAEITISENMIILKCPDSDVCDLLRYFWNHHFE